MKRIGFLILVVILLTTGSAVQVTAQAGDQTCPSIVDAAVQTVGTACIAIGRNEVCYGHALVAATFQTGAASPTFTDSGDIVQLPDLQALITKPADPSTQEWGIALLKVQADLPVDGDTTLTFVLFGDTEITSAVDPTAEPAPLPDCKMTNQSGSNINVRGMPGTNADIVGVLANNEQVATNGRNAAGDWLCILTDSGIGWVYAPLVSVDCGIDTLPVMDDGAAAPVYAHPMQAFTLRTGEAGSCEQAPDGLLIHSPTGQRTHIMINGVQIELASAGFVTAQPNGALTVSGLEGEIGVTASGTTVTVTPRYQTTVPLADLGPAGPPTDPAPFDDLSTVPGLLTAIIYGEPFNIDTARDLPLTPDMIRSGSFTTATSLPPDARFINDTIRTGSDARPCTWTDKQDKFNDGVTLTLSPDGDQLSYVSPKVTTTLTRVSDTTYVSAPMIDPECLLRTDFVLTLEFTSPTTFVMEALFTIREDGAGCRTGNELAISVTGEIEE